MHIAFLIHAMGPGGAERVVAQLANGLAARGHEITLLTLSSNKAPSFYRLDSSVQQIALGQGCSPSQQGLVWSIRQSLTLLWRLRQFLRLQKPEVLLAFINTTNVLALVATSGLSQAVVVSERSDPEFTPLKTVWKIARWATYPKADALVVQSGEVRKWFSHRIQRHTWVIPNPVLSPPPDSPEPNPLNPHSRIIAVGRLSKEKGFDILLEAFARVADRFPMWTLDVWGEGALRLELEAQRDRLGLRERVHFLGLTQNIDACYATADIFVLSSRFEGFPNALCEAMAHGLPVVATSCSGGVRSILDSNINGLLVPPRDPQALAGALSRLMTDESLRKMLGAEARNVINRFNLESVLTQWENCLVKSSLAKKK